jgi:hypothetical protein
VPVLASLGCAPPITSAHVGRDSLAAWTPARPAAGADRRPAFTRRSNGIDALARLRLKRTEVVVDAFFRTLPASVTSVIVAADRVDGTGQASRSA